MNNHRIAIGKLSIDATFHDFVEKELLPAIDVTADAFWAGMESIISELTPENERLLMAAWRS